LSRFEPIYFQALSDSTTEFKNVTVKELIEHISKKYPPVQEEINAVEATLRDQWDPTNHIENLFQSVGKGTEG
jgi:inorganic pyrophosphatase/exopolyphosphatase